jgi:sugar (pentulose or hexulose) kinase
MNIRMRAAAVAIAATGALGLGVLGAGSALAGTGPVTAVTHASQHPDTTNAAGGVCGTSDNGPTWALDNLSRQFAVTDNGDGTFTVVVTDHGSFSGFANPADCTPLTSNGPIDGTYTLTVTSATGPDPAGLKPQYTGAVSTTQMVRDLFDGTPTSIVGGDYYYSYQNGNYVQDTQGISGEIRGH